MLTFEYCGDRGVEIHANEAGLRYLIAELQKLLEHTKPNSFNHMHLMSPEWGGNELSAEVQGEGDPIHHVKVYCWKNIEE